MRPAPDARSIPGVTPTDDLLRALETAATATDIDQLEESVLRATVATMCSDSVAVTSLDPQRRPARTHPGGFFGMPEQSLFDRLHCSSPWALATHTQNRGGVPLRISDVLSQRHYRSLAIYTDLFRSLEIDHQVAFSVPLPERAPLCVVVNRHGVDFTAAEITALTALRTTLSAVAQRPQHDTVPADPLPLVDRDRIALQRLTMREAAILALVSSGLSNFVAGRQLGISERTVSKHLEHVFAKLSVTNRTAAAAVWHGSRERP
jgi:DNA-binding CsgD family transcriptional regulator